jgi:hypothetical protein
LYSLVEFPGGVTAADEREISKRRAKAHQYGDFWTPQDLQSRFSREKHLFQLLGTPLQREVLIKAEHCGKSQGW